MDLSASQAHVYAIRRSDVMLAHGIAVHSGVIETGHHDKRGDVGVERRPRPTLYAGTENSTERACSHRKYGDMVTIMAQYRISDAASLLGVSNDTVRRWVATGTLAATKDAVGRSVIDGADLAARAKHIIVPPPRGPFRRRE